MIKEGNEIYFISGQPINRLEKGTYFIQQKRDGSFTLIQGSDFKYSSLIGINKIYEDLVINHISKSSGNCGFIFSGISGSGKTATIKNIIFRLGLPVIIVDKVIEPGVLLNILNRVNSDTVLFFDEIEKVYKEDLSEKLLSFFDGLPSKNRVFSFLTMNEEDISEYYFNRPGRFLFNFKFGSLETDYAVSLFDVPTEYKERFREFVDKIDNLSYDIIDKLKSLIEIHGWENMELISSVFNVRITNYVIDYEIEYQVQGVTKTKEGTYHQAKSPGVLVSLENRYEEDIYLSNEIFETALKSPEGLDLTKHVKELKRLGIEKCLLKAVKQKTQTKYKSIKF